MRVAATLLLLLGTTLPAVAQGDAVPDTLDWKRYFPLAVGNAWEYGTTEGPPYWHVAVVDELTSDQWHYFVLREHYGGHIFEKLVRYDGLAYVVFLDTAAEDTIPAPRFPAMTRPGQLAVFDLAAAFGDALTYPGDPDFTYDVSGGYDQAVLDGIEVAGLKCFEMSWWEECYAADIGFLGGGSLQESWLTYVRVGDFEWGESQLAAETDPGDASMVRVGHAHPNPSVGRFAIPLTLDAPAEIDAAVFDLLGRRVATIAAGLYPSGSHVLDFDGKGAAAGAYVVRIAAATEGAGRSVHTQWITRVR